MMFSLKQKFFLLTFFLAASSLSAKKDKFLSGIGIFMGIGGTNMSTTPDGSGSTSWPLQVGVTGEGGKVTSNFEIKNTSSNTNLTFANNTNSLTVLDATTVTPAGATPNQPTLTVENGAPVIDQTLTIISARKDTADTKIFKINGTIDKTVDMATAEIDGEEYKDWIDFGQKGSVKNSSGFSWNLGVLMQKTLDSYTMGFRCVLGTRGDSSQLKYKTGPVSLFVEEGDGEDFDFSGIVGIADETKTTFRLKNKWYAEFIFEFGYVVAQRLQLFVGPGLIVQNQRLSYIGESGRPSSSLSKTATGSVIACGARYALNHHAALGLEYQRQWLGKKSWENVASIVPKDIYCCGIPMSKTTANLFLVTLTYVFCGK
ncbi:outer membrane protein [Holospora undulata]|uniref:Outer membrane protein beta-barrel domain-containing protein n=1 Tax=Holospora undulata HU1 TaxID=1321371 RepID=A0A061JIA6_9PROT|nr:hypothetical protein [Holospora undulata]ETZ05362.1 hypothetical protein K737_300191 [Holospora undulata HU1]